jgi:eukaryotic-like serine/threonine-protein kinase
VTDTRRPSGRLGLDSARLPEGTLVDGRFEIAEPLGQGASGAVYSATDQRSGARVAVKLLHRHLLTDRQIQKRFYREASILSRLDGPHIVPIVALGEHEGLLYMALELASGTSLESLMLREGPIPTERAVRIVMQICEALENAHAASVIHRDLKPANVIVDRAPDGSDRVKVLDFGMAKLVHGDGPGSTALTEQNMVFGTPEYMSPEQARGDDLDETTDVYAAGIILYELLTGTVPFTAPTPVGVMTAHLVETPMPPRQRAPDRAIGLGLEQVVLSAVAKDRRARYPSALALRNALARALETPDSLDLTPRGALEIASGLSPSAPAPVRSPSGGPDGPFVSDYGLPAYAWVVIGLGAALAGIAIGIYVSLR